MLTLELGKGDIIISDIREKDTDAEWHGICFTRRESGEIGDIAPGMEGKTTTEVGAFLRVTATNPKSLDVLIEACERAKARFTLTDYYVDSHRLSKLQLELLLKAYNGGLVRDDYWAHEADIDKLDQHGLINHKDTFYSKSTSTGRAWLEANGLGSFE